MRRMSYRAEAAQEHIRRQMLLGRRPKARLFRAQDELQSLTARAEAAQEQAQAARAAAQAQRQVNVAELAQLRARLQQGEQVLAARKQLVGASVLPALSCKARPVLADLCIRQGQLKCIHCVQHTETVLAH